MRTITIQNWYENIVYRTMGGGVLLGIGTWEERFASEVKADKEGLQKRFLEWVDRYANMHKLEIIEKNNDYATFK